MRLGIIGGTGSARLLGTEAPYVELPATTPFGAASAPLRRHRRGSHELLFLPRHGPVGQIPPHGINYRANVWLFHQHPVDLLLAVNAVGGMGPGAVPGALVFPDQLIDYTWGRAQTYSGEAGLPLLHVEFTEPFCADSRQRLLSAARAAAIGAVEQGTYGATQGPRLESAAEIARLVRDGCTVVGMTGMPEAALARELDLPYALCAVVVNRAAGLAPPAGVAPGLHDQMAASLDQGMAAVGRVIDGLLAGAA